MSPTLPSSTSPPSPPSQKQPAFQPQGAHAIPPQIFDKFEAVEKYLVDSLIPEAQDNALKGALERNKKEGLPSIDVSPNDGKFLYLLAKMNNVKRVLEVGTLGGYSGVWLLKALPPNGHLTTLELSPQNAHIASLNVQTAGFTHMVDIKIGPALETLSSMSQVSPPIEPYDLIFIDADKDNNLEYFKYALGMSRVGTVIVVDNVVRGGKVVDSGNEEGGVVGVRRLMEWVKGGKGGAERVECTGLQTVGGKGWDGFLLGVVVA